MPLHTCTCTGSHSYSHTRTHTCTHAGMEVFVSKHVYLNRCYTLLSVWAVVSINSCSRLGYCCALYRQFCGHNSHCSGSCCNPGLVWSSIFGILEETRGELWVCSHTSTVNVIFFTGNIFCGRVICTDEIFARKYFCAVNIKRKYCYLKSSNTWTVGMAALRGRYSSGELGGSVKTGPPHFFDYCEAAASCTPWATSLAALFPMCGLVLCYVVGARCYVVWQGWTDLEQMHSGIKQLDCMAFWPHRPLPAAYQTFVQFCVL